MIVHKRVQYDLFYIKTYFKRLFEINLCWVVRNVFEKTLIHQSDIDDFRIWNELIHDFFLN